MADDSDFTAPCAEMRGGMHDEVRAWDDGFGLVVAVYHEPSETWTVTGDDETRTWAEILVLYAGSKSWQPLASGALGVNPTPGEAVTLHGYTDAELDTIRAEAWDEGYRADRAAMETWHEPSSAELMYWPDVPNPYRKAANT